MIVNYWPQWFRNLYGGEWPVNYVCFDIETTGYSMSHDVITEIAHCLVQDGEIVNELSIILDWTNHAIVPDHWLRRRLHEVRQQMSLSGYKYHITYERMQKEGMKPEKALQFYDELFTTLMQRDSLFVAHGGYAFDERMIAANMAGFIGRPDFGFGDNDMLCTDGLEKASQAATHPRLQPQPGDTLRSYFHRVKYTRLPGVKSNLSDHCFHKYDFAKKRGLKAKDMHGAATDSRCVHYLMEEFRTRIKAGSPPAVSSVVEPPKMLPREAAIVAGGNSRGRRRGQRNN